MSKVKQNEYNQENVTLKMICEIKKLYEDDFNNWKECYKNLVEAVFEKDDKRYKKENDLNWLDDNFVKKYPMFKYLKENSSNVFSFIVMLNKYGVKSRQEIAKIILGKNECNTNFTGVPAGQQGLSEETFKKISNIDENLNELAYKLINNEKIIIDENIRELSDTFKNVFYVLAPEKYYPSDKNTKLILEKINKLEDDKEPLEIAISKDEGEYFARALSYVAWLEENQVKNILDKFIDKDNKKPKNIILTGIPGTGKTYSIMEYLKKNEKTISGYEFVQFHPSYDYEDFIEGLKPVPLKNGQIEFKLIDGVFKELCKKAYKDKEKTYVMVIDEINRANLSRVFGELLYCLEYRDEFVSTKMTTYIQDINKTKDNKDKIINSISINENDIGKFTIPSNVIILGTMNEIDRSIDAFDLALRRRFIWEDIGFSSTALRLYRPFFTTENFDVKYIDNLIDKAEKLNKKLNDEIGVNYQLGHTYYFKIIDYFDGDFGSALCDLWEYHIKSIVREYCKIKFGENEIENKLKEYKEIIVGKNSCDG